MTIDTRAIVALLLLLLPDAITTRGENTDGRETRKRFIPSEKPCSISPAVRITC